MPSTKISQHHYTILAGKETGMTAASLMESVMALVVTTQRRR
jgi:hypothetical protein